jgi:hypothetical protein
MALKTCRVCLVARDTGDFYTKRKKGRDYLDSYCKSCSQRMARERYSKRGPEYQRLKSAEYRAKHPDKIREYRNRFLDKNGSQYLRYRNTMDGRARNLWDAAKTNARNKGLPFALEKAWILERLAVGVCEETGLALSMEQPETGKRRNPRAPSLDRIDPTLGYIPSNVRLVCWQYNAAKSEFGVEVLKEMVEALSQRLDNQQPSPARGRFNDHPERE